MLLIEGSKIEIPSSEPVKNATTDAVKHMLDELCALTKLDFDFEGTGSGFKKRPGFRDLMAFTFQPQNIIANPDVLFFKADTYGHREKLKTIFPYVLNAITAETLARQHEAENVRRELARKERELTNLQTHTSRWLADLRAWAVEARELGLIGQAIPPEATAAALLNMLRAVVSHKPSTGPTSGSITDAVRELVLLQEEESNVSIRLAQLRRRFAEMSKLRETGQGYRAALLVQRDRLDLSKWLKSLALQAGSCPICEQAFAENGDEHLDELIKALHVVEKEAELLERVPASFEREILRVKEEIEDATQLLGGISHRIDMLEHRSAEARDSRFRAEAISKFIGRLEQALVTYDAVTSDGGLSAEVAELRERLDELVRKIAAGAVRARTERALDKVALFAGRLLPELDAERPSDPIALSPTDLTVKVKGDNREDYLWEIGSGANWLSYHVAIALSLQQFFIDVQNSPVPSFLVFDQPSQVYFPRRLARDDKNDNPDPKLADEDARAVQKVFALFGSVVKGLQGQLQVLVLDHAGHDVWGEVPDLHLVEEWRDGRKLVPKEWLALEVQVESPALDQSGDQ